MSTAGARRAGAPVKMVYATSRPQDSVGQMLIAPLQRVLDRASAGRVDDLGTAARGARGTSAGPTLPLIRDYDTFFAGCSAGRFDIGLAPLPDDEFHRGKSNNKFREYASCGLAGVYSDMSVYNTSVQHEITGLLRANDDAPGTRQSSG